MIARIWSGRTRAADADAYGEFLHLTAYPDYGGVPGNRGWILLRRPAGDAVEFTFVSLPAMDWSATLARGGVFLLDQ